MSELEDNIKNNFKELKEILERFNGEVPVDVAINYVTPIISKLSLQTPYISKLLCNGELSANDVVGILCKYDYITSDLLDSVTLSIESLIATGVDVTELLTSVVNELLRQAMIKIKNSHDKYMIVDAGLIDGIHHSIGINVESLVKQIADKYINNKPYIECVNRNCYVPNENGRKEGGFKIDLENVISLDTIKSVGGFLMKKLL